MTVHSQQLYDDPDTTWFLDWEDTDGSSTSPGDARARGILLWEGRRPAAKAGSAGFNQQQQQSNLRQALTQFESDYTNWAALTNAQKDAANRRAQRAVATLIRQLLNALDSPGV